MAVSDPRGELVRLLEELPNPFPYDRAALLLAADAFPGLDPAPIVERLDLYAAQVTALADGDTEPRRRLAALRRVIFEEEGFHGNREQYYDLRNSYLHEVLNRKLGIPITLAVVMLAVTRRLGWPVQPVNFPGHVLVRYDAPNEILAVDPFHGGLILAPEELVERWRFGTGYEAPSLARMLEPATPRAVVLRMLNNVRIIHEQQQEYRQAARTTELMALVEPENAGYHRALGYYWLAAREPSRAVHHLEQYLLRMPQAPDAEDVRRRLDALRNNTGGLP